VNIILLLMEIEVPRNLSPLLIMIGFCLSPHVLAMRFVINNTLESDTIGFVVTGSYSSQPAYESKTLVMAPKQVGVLDVPNLRVASIKVTVDTGIAGGSVFALVPKDDRPLLGTVKLKVFIDNGKIKFEGSDDSGPLPSGLGGFTAGTH
jgi:hypothetical protein